MKTVKLNFTVPQDVVESLKSHISERKRSAFITEAVRARLHELEEEQLKQALIEGYQATNPESAEINRDWEQATLEQWD